MQAVPELPSRADRLVVLAKVTATLPQMRFDTWNFGDSTGFEAMIDAGKLLNDDTYFPFAHGWMRAWASRSSPFSRMDATAPGLAMVNVALLANDTILLEGLIGLARYLMSRPLDRGIFDMWERMCLIPPYGGEVLSPKEAALLAQPPGGSCVDCLHFDPPFFTALGKALDNPEFTEIGVTQALAYVEALQQPDGIFDHFFMHGVPGTFGPGWGRGQGWSMLGLLDVLKNISEEHVARPQILAAVQKQIRRMIELQRLDGRWWCVVHEPDSGEEGSTAAFMATGFARAIKMDIMDKSEVLPHAINALAGALADTDKDGHLRNVTAAVMASTRPSHYVHTPRGFLVPWGQGPLALAICEMDELV
jgi:unsaturated rhamnogalacturonyl hydrolase